MKIILPLKSDSHNTHIPDSIEFKIYTDNDKIDSKVYIKITGGDDREVSVSFSELKRLLKLID